MNPVDSIQFGPLDDIFTVACVFVRRHGGDATVRRAGYNAVLSVKSGHSVHENTLRVGTLLSYNTITGEYSVLQPDVPAVDAKASITPFQPLVEGDIVHLEAVDGTGDTTRITVRRAREPGSLFKTSLIIDDKRGHTFGIGVTWRITRVDYTPRLPEAVGSVVRYLLSNSTDTYQYAVRRGSNSWVLTDNIGYVTNAFLAERGATEVVVNG